VAPASRTRGSPASSTSNGRVAGERRGAGGRSRDDRYDNGRPARRSRRERFLRQQADAWPSWDVSPSRIAATTCSTRTTRVSPTSPAHRALVPRRLRPPPGRRAAKTDESGLQPRLPDPGGGFFAAGGASRSRWANFFSRCAFSRENDASPRASRAGGSPGEPGVTVTSGA
jgi:hypothetical protein